MKKERMFKVFIYAVSILHIMFGILVLILSIKTPGAGLLRLLSLYTTLFGIMLITLYEISTQYHNLLHKLKNSSKETIDFLVGELENKENK